MITGIVREHNARHGYGDVRGKFLFLVGKPRLTERFAAFDTAMNWMSDVKLDKGIYFEDATDGLVSELDVLMGASSS